MKKKIKFIINKFLFINVYLKNHFLVWRLINYIFNKSMFYEYTLITRGVFNYNTSQKNFYELRRNIHRIEKGLISKPRRDFFAYDYIFKTVSDYIQFNNMNISGNTTIWAGEVLNNYFKNIKNYPQSIGKLKQKFENFYEISTNKLIPCELEKSFEYSFSDVQSIFSSKKSVRYYSNKIVDNNLIEKAMRVASLAPSGCNRQPYKYYFFNEKYEKVQNILRFSAGTNGWGSTVYNCAVLTANLSAFTHTNSRHAGHVDSILSLTPFTLALKSFGVESCLINWVDDPVNEIKLKKLINANDYEKVIITIAFGYPSNKSMVANSSRLGYEKISNL